MRPTFNLRSLTSRWSRPSTRRPRASRPRTAHCNFFRPQLEQLEQRQLLSTLVDFDLTSGSLLLLGAAAGSTVEVEGMSNGAIGVLVNGQLHSSAPGGLSFDHALTGARITTLRNISFTGGASADSLTLSNLTGKNLSVVTDGSVTLTGAVTEANQLAITAESLTIDGAASAAILALTSRGLLNIDAGGSLSARDAGNGGTITAAADNIINVGQIGAEGAKGGSIVLTARDYLNAGTISAAGSAGGGGSVQVDFTHSYIDTTAAQTTASGSGGAGGQVSIDGGSSGRLFSSGAFDATGTNGGDIDLFGQNIFLVAATADASGTTGSGGRIRVGGDNHGNNPNVPNAQTVDVTGATTFRANARAGSAAGRVIVWSQTRTDFSGSISAKSNGGAGGFIDVSSRGQLNDGGNADAGMGGMLLLDPQNLVINSASNTPAGVFPQFNLVNPSDGGAFGAQIVPLKTGNIVVTEVPDIQTGKGVFAVYLFNGQTGALISALTGVGSNGEGATATALTNGNYVVSSPDWDGGVGAVTWGSGTTGVSGTPSASNSLVGSTVFDHVGGLPGSADGTGGGITALNNGNYVVDSPNWGSDGSTSDGKGAVTWGNGTAGSIGVVSAANSLVGSTVHDLVGGSGGIGGVTSLMNGNYVVDSWNWGSDAGAVTWGNGAIGTTGVISSANSLVGGTGSSASYDGDQVGFGGVTALTNGNYVVDSDQWNAQDGAVTWGNGMTGIGGVVSASNSLVGSNAAVKSGGEPDLVGQNGVVALTNGNYVVVSPRWSADGGTGAGIGAVTWGNGTTGITGPVSTTNSLVGTEGEPIAGGNGAGGAGVTALANGNYVVDTPYWGILLSEQAGLGADPLGAVTWENGTTEATGTVNSTNSFVGTIVGSTAFDVGWGGVTALTDGNYVIDSYNWNGNRGAVTWANGNAVTTGTVSASNSLVGSFVKDYVGGGTIGTDGGGSGEGGIIALQGGNYVVVSPNWDANTGAVTWADGTKVTSGTISASNSLIGDKPGDEVGELAGSGSHGVIPLANDNYVVLSSIPGTTTWGNGGSGVKGTLSSVASLTGVSGLVIEVNALPNGNYVVSVNNANGAETATWVDGANGVTLDGQNTIDPQNSAIAAGAQPIGLGNSFILSSDALAGLPGASIGTADPNLLTYAFGQGQTITVTPDFITRTLNTGTNVTLQASNDITINSPITENPTGSAGNLTLAAGRSINLNAGINTAGGNLTLIANDSKADGVVDSDRESGNAAVTMASGVTLNTGSRTLSVDLKNSTDKTNNGSGVVTLLGITANSTTLSSTSTLGISISGTTPGDGTAAGSYTQVSDTGPINLNGAPLSVAHETATAAGTSFVIVQSSSGISGDFNGLSEGATVTAADGTTFSISYKGDGGKEVVLTQLSSSPPPMSQPPTFTSAANTTFAVGAAGTFTVTASGSPAPTLSESSSDTLPSGVTFNATTGVLSGTPAAGSSGVYTLHFTASNSAGNADQTFTLTVAAATTPPNITSGNSAVFTAGKAGSFTVTAAGSPTPTLSESGALPSGVTFTDHGNGTATLGGAPAADTQGTYHFTIKAHNGVGSDFTQSFTLTVNPPPVPPPPPPPPPLIVPPLLAFFDSLLGGTETVNADGTETIVDSFFGIPLLVSTFDHSGDLVSVDLFGIDVTFLFG